MKSQEKKKKQEKKETQKAMHACKYPKVKKEGLCIPSEQEMYGKYFTWWNI